MKALDDPKLPQPLYEFAAADLTDDADRSLLVLRQRYQEALSDLGSEAVSLLREWPARKAGVKAEKFSYRVRGKEVTGDNYLDSLSQQKIPKIAAPSYKDWGELLSFLMRENLPGAYPYTGGVYPYRRHGEDPTRMFAGEGTPESLDIFAPSLSTIPCVNRLANGSSAADSPQSRISFWKNLAYSKCNIACSIPPMYWSTGIQYASRSSSIALSLPGHA